MKVSMSLHCIHHLHPQLPPSNRHSADNAVTVSLHCNALYSSLKSFIPPIHVCTHSIPSSRPATATPQIVDSHHVIALYSSTFIPHSFLPSTCACTAAPAPAQQPPLCRQRSHRQCQQQRQQQQQQCLLTFILTLSCIHR